MKAKKIVSIAIAVLLIALTAVSASAATLTEEDYTGDTEVTAHINGNPPGDVSYIITIPDVVDFGELTKPVDDSTDSYKDVTYTVEATEINGLDANTQQVSVYVRDKNSNPNSQEFKIANKSNSNIAFQYEVYDSTMLTPQHLISDDTYVGSVGHFLYGFTEQGQTVEGTLRLNQVQLYPYDIVDIVGDYSGYMVFFSTVDSQ